MSCYCKSSSQAKGTKSTSFLTRKERSGFRSLGFMNMTVNVLWLFLAMPWVGLQFVIVVFPDHTHLLYVMGSCFKGQHSEILKEDRSHFYFYFYETNNDLLTFINIFYKYS